MSTQRRLLALVFILHLFSISLGQNTTGTIRGTVVDSNNEPIYGAVVAILSAQTGAYTNEEGIFSIGKLEPGDHYVQVTYIGMDTVSREFVLGDGQTITTSFQLQVSSTQLETVKIQDQYNGRIRKRELDIGTDKVTARQINLMPSLGAPDLGQYMQVLPGVVFTGDQGGQLYIRGGTPIQNMVLLDGMIIYSPFHSIGLFSTFDADYVRSVDVYSAAFPAQYGGRISSIMDIKTRNPNANGVRGKVNINPVTAGLLIEGPFKAKKNGGGGSGFLVSARHSYLDRTSKSLYSYVDDTSGLPFSFTDIYGKLTFTDGINKLNLFGFYNGDNVNYEFPANLTWDQSGGGAQFRLLPASSNVIFTGNFAYSSFSSGLQAASEAFPRSSLIQGFNGGLRFTYIVNSVDEFTYGINLLGFRTDYKFTNSFGLVTSQIFNNTEATADFNYKKVFQRTDATKADSITDIVVLEPGIHLHYYNDHSFISFEPRLRAKVNLNRVSISGGIGMYSQNLLAATSDRDVVNLFQGYLAAPLNVDDQIKDHTLQTSTHYLLGAEIELIDNLSTRVEGWYKDFTQLTNINRDKVFPSDPDFITETGSAQGLDLILRYETPRWYVYGTYGLAKVDRKDRVREYNPVWDRRHNINGLVAYTIGEVNSEDDIDNVRPKFTDPKWEVSLRWNLGSGFPFTQTQGFFEKVDFVDNGAQTNYVNQNGNLGILYAEEINGGRLPYYHRLDFSAKRRWVFKNKFMVELQVSTLNLYNRRNVFYFDRVRFATVYQLPLLPSLGLTIKY